MLCVDIGNTAIKCAVVDGERILGAEVLATPADDDVGALDLAMRRVSGAVLELQGAAVTSVVPRLTRDVARVASAYSPRRPFVLDASARLPIDLAVPIPTSVGADRICATVGALGTRGRSALVVDAGSAVTVDRVRDNRFLGGVILPGPVMSIAALGRGGSQLPHIDYSSVTDPFPDLIDTTESAMVLGASLALLGGVRESIRRVEALTGHTSIRYLTGGYARVLAVALGTGWRSDPHLTLRGLARIARINGVVSA